MKKIVIIIFSLFYTFTIYAQTGGNNTGGTNNGGTNNGSGTNYGGQAPTNFQNPYGTNPYGTNPYLNGTNPNSQNQNIFDNQNNKNNPDNRNGNKNNTSKEEGNKTGSNEQNNQLNFQDNNRNNTNSPDKEAIELYKNDPDYLKYLGKEEKDKSTAELINDPGNQVIAKSNIYGADFLSNNGFNASSQTPTTVPEDYRLGVGDEVVISIWGSAEFQNSFVIGRDGSIFPSQIGKIYLQGLSFEAARNVIQGRFRKSIPAGSNIDIAMGSVRTIRVSVVGEVLRPGTFTMSAFNTPINALGLAGGLTPNGNLRDIQILRNGVVIEHLDVYRYLQNGNFGKEIYLQDNDYISVKLYDKIVEAKGAFKRPMLYQLAEYETLDDLIKLAGGPTFNARESFIRVKTIEKEQEKYIDFNGRDYFSTDNSFEFVLRDGDVVILNNINEGLTNTVTIQGEVKYPEVYQLKENMRLFDLIKKAGGLNNTAFTSRAYVYRQGKISDENEAIKVNIQNLEDYENPDNVILQSGDRINILSSRLFDDNFEVEVIGSVKKPGKQLYFPDMKLMDVLIASGGLSMEAESGRIEISNITDSVDRYSMNGTPINIKVVSISPNLEIDEVSENITIKPFDRIFVRKKKEISTQEKIFIVGEVDYPGEYALLGKNERITNLIKRSGGLTTDAYPEGAKLYRSTVGQVVINLNDALVASGGRFDIVLEDGDRIIIPTKNDIVTVMGEVQDPINIKFNKERTDIMNYIDAAGGFGEDPWRRRIKVKYQNGRSKSTKNFLFFRFYPKVKPGSVVTVPKKPERDGLDFKELFQYGITTATSVLTIILLTNGLK